MKKLILVLIAILFSLPVFADTYVNGYYKKNGTYVAPHYRSSPDSNPYNNWSTKGNINPYTGKVGTKEVRPSYDYYGTKKTNKGLNGY